MTNLDTVIDIASTQFVDNLSDYDKNRMTNGIMWSDFDQDDYLIEVCESYNFPIEEFTNIDNGNHDKFLCAIIAKLTDRNIQFALSKCYDYLAA